MSMGTPLFDTIVSMKGRPHWHVPIDTQERNQNAERIYTRNK